RSPPASSRRRPLPFLLASRSHVERLLPAPSSLQTTQSRQPPPPPVLVQRRPCTRFKELTVRRKGDAKAPQDDLWFGLSSTEKRRLMWCSYWLYSGEELTESCSKEQKRRKKYRVAI
uniref:Uncharacterized protein n=1 Tax=Aegilops tauschii subsp. strangulata TaxID=200361 RepID=A0A453K298_AEGTS